MFTVTSVFRFYLGLLYAVAGESLQGAAVGLNNSKLSYMQISISEIKFLPSIRLYNLWDMG
jgi:hypothetical protein